MYIKDPESKGLRSDKNKKKYGNRIVIRLNFLVFMKSYKVLCHACSLYVLISCVLYGACSLYCLIDRVLCRAVHQATSRDTIVWILHFLVP